MRCRKAPARFRNPVRDAGVSRASMRQSVRAGNGRQAAAGVGLADALAIVPAQQREARLDLLHDDASLDRANQGAEVAPDALLLDDARHVDALAVDIGLAVAGFRVRRDALVRAVLTGDVAELASDAEVGANLRDDLVVEVEIAPVHDVGHGAPAEVLDGAVAVVHRRGADLHGRGSESDMLGSIVPVADPADAADGDAYFFRHTRDQVQRDGLHRRAAVAAVGGLAADL